MKRLFILLFSMVMAGEMEVDGDLKVAGNVQVGTIDSLEHEIVTLKLIIAQLQAQIALLETQMAFLGQDLNNADCFGVVGGDAVLDNCGTCDNDLSNDCLQDCNGEWSGTAVYDVCGICGGDAESEDDCNYALYFDGNSNFVDLTNTTIAIQGSNPRTIMAWVKTIGNNDDDMKIISTGNTETSAAFNILINDQGVINVMGYSNDYYTNTGISVNNNIWNHIAVTYNGTEVKIYINGEFDHGTNKSWNTNSQENYIGKSNHFESEGTADYYKGLLDDISVWDYAFEPSDIQLYLNAMPSGDESGLVGYWNFNEGSDNILNDLSGNENHGTIHGATWVNR